MTKSYINKTIGRFTLSVFTARFSLPNRAGKQGQWLYMNFTHLGLALRVR